MKSHATSEILLQSSFGKDGLYSFGSLHIVVLPYNTHSTHVVHTLTTIAPHIIDWNSYANKGTTTLGPSLYA